MENYYGFPGGINGKKLAEQGVEQARRLGVEILSEEVTAIEQGLNGHAVRTTGGEMEAKCILLATGKARQALPVKGMEEFRGRASASAPYVTDFIPRKVPGPNWQRPVCRGGIQRSAAVQPGDPGFHQRPASDRLLSGKHPLCVWPHPGDLGAAAGGRH